jgi:hypothetical protein
MTTKVGGPPRPQHYLLVPLPGGDLPLQEPSQPAHKMSSDGNNEADMIEPAFHQGLKVVIATRLGI